MKKPLVACLSLFSVWIWTMGAPAVVTAGEQAFQTKIKTPRMQPLPDMRVSSFELIGEPVAGSIVRDGKNVQVVRQRFHLVIENGGQAAAAEQRLGVFYEVPGKAAYRVFLDSSEDGWFLTQYRFEPGTRRTYSGFLCFDEAFSATRGRVVARVDIVDQEFMPAYGRVRESNETNNESARLDITLPPIFRAAVPAPTLQIQPASSFSITEGLLDILGSAIRGQIHLNNDNGHSDSDHFTPNNPFRSNDSRIQVNDYSEQFTVPMAAFGLNSMDYRYYVRDLDAEFGGGAGFRGRDLLGIRNGRLVLTIRFETGGRVEFRGWELTTGIYYDLSAPDIDVTRLDVYVYLTPFLRDDGLFTYSDARIMTDLAISFIGAYDTVLMNDIRGRVRSHIADEINRTLRGAILRADIKNAFEVRAMEAFHAMFRFSRLTRMIVENDRIAFEYR